MSMVLPKEFPSRRRIRVFRKYPDINLFKEFKVGFGDLVWNDYELCFPFKDAFLLLNITRTFYS